MSTLSRDSYQKIFNLISEVADPSQGWEDPDGERLVAPAREFLSWMSAAVEFQTQREQECRRKDFLLQHETRTIKPGRIFPVEFHYSDLGGGNHKWVEVVDADINAAIDEAGAWK